MSCCDLIGNLLQGHRKFFTPVMFHEQRTHWPLHFSLHPWPRAFRLYGHALLVFCSDGKSTEIFAL